jgi:hypothetical protein
MQGRFGIRGVVFLFAWAVLAVGYSQGVTVTLTDGNSVTHFHPDTQGGQYDWSVDQVNQLAQQWFWYRIGSTGPEHSLDTMDPAAVITQPDAADFTAVYTGTQLQIKTSYSLTGGSIGSGMADLGETIRIKNVTAGPLAVYFFQYVDFDLNGNPYGDTVQWTNANSVLQYKGATSLAETVDTINGAAATHREVNVFPNTLNSLNDAFPTTLSDNLGPIGGPTVDVTWGFQWNFLSIPAGGTAIISKDKNLIVPEPAALGLLVMGSILAMRRRRAA